MINKDKIFDLFNSDNEDEYGSVHIDFMDDPYIKIGMFVKIIKNNKVFLYKLKKFFKESNKEYDEELTQISSSFTTYNRAWHYIKNIDIDEPNHLKALLKHDTLRLLETLQMAILYFEDREEYEKCAHLYKIQKLVKKF